MTRGTLRIYLGAAPGVGKTMAMLAEGRRRAERGTDVVVGFCETHGRTATAVAVRPWVSQKPTTTSVPRSARRRPSASIAMVLPTPGAAPR